MDLLASLNMDELPEQQTRMMHLMNEHPDFELKLGFDACCTCGKSLKDATPIACPGCKRVHYCSESCRQQDASALTSGSSGLEENGEEAETAMGHTSIICAVMNTCNDDEAVEEGDDSELDDTRRQASRDRIRSEYESYPATLANVISEGPCYKNVLRECSTKKKKLVLHVIGASDDAELTNGNSNDDEHSVFKDYAEALTNLTSEHKGIPSVEIIFVGPECPAKDMEYSTQISSIEKQGGEAVLSVRTIRGIYNGDILQQNHLSKPDIVVFFNPGFTVPDYEDWNETLKSIAKGTPFLSTTNTEMEGIADCQYLLDQDMIQTIPPALADMFGVYSAPEDNEEEDLTCMFTENPFRGNRVRQSGTMANDLYVKNRWMLGGILDSFDASKNKKEMSAKKMKTGMNTKADNPALI